jgi:hypothetical protein
VVPVAMPAKPGKGVAVGHALINKTTTTTAALVETSAPVEHLVSLVFVNVPKDKQSVPGRVSTCKAARATAVYAAPLAPPPRPV